MRRGVISFNSQETTAGLLNERLPKLLQFVLQLCL